MTYRDGYLEQYKIAGTLNLDPHPAFTSKSSYKNFQAELIKFQNLLKKLVKNGENKTFYKFGDGDYYFLKKEAIGSAAPGRRALLTKNYSQINHKEFTTGVLKNDYITVEIYNRNLFLDLFPKRKIDFSAEYGYGLTANKWLLRTFAGSIGLIGAREKMELIQVLMQSPAYRNYLGLDKFEDYISIPQKGACDDLAITEKIAAEQLKNAKAKIFLLGIGHVKSGLLHRLKNYHNAVYLDVGSAVDALAGVVNVTRPYMGDWTNFVIRNYDYSTIDFLGYSGKGKYAVLSSI